MTARSAPKIVFLHPSDELYGADRILLELVDLVGPELCSEVWLPTDLGHPSSPLCAELAARSVKLRHVDLPVLRRAYRTPPALVALGVRTLRLARMLRMDGPDVVYCTTSAAYLGIASARLAGISNVVGHVQEFWTASDSLVLSPLARLARRLIAISPAVADALPSSLRPRTRVVLNATPDPGAEPVPNERTGRLRYLVASRWNNWKGHRTLLAAWDAAGCPGELIVLGGMPPSGPGVDVRTLAAGIKDPGSVRIVGEVANPRPFVVEADVVVVPSDDPEPFGLVAIEAFAAGRPVIASRSGGLADIVKHGADGWLFAPRDVDALACILAGLDRSTAQRAGAAARRTYERRFTLDRYAVEWREMLGVVRAQ